MTKPVLPSSVGDLADRVSILSLKVARLPGGGQQFARRELMELDPQFREAAIPAEMYQRLSRINAELWDLEDATRKMSIECDFGAAWRAVKAQITHLNDVRAHVKRQINDACCSEIVEVKSHGL